LRLANGERYPSGALSQGKHRAESTKRPNPAFVAIPVVVVALAVGAFLLLSRGGEEEGTRQSTVAPTSARTPPFAFQVHSAVPVPTTGATAAKLRGPAKEGAAAVAKTLSGLYAAAFLDPANWESGRYDSVWSYFEPGAATAARRDAEDLTAGARAGEAFASITPSRGRLDVKVLFDSRNKAAGYSATVLFGANASAGDGTVTRLVSTGTYFLQPTSRGWKVSSYEVRREDREAKAASAAAPSAGATPSTGSANGATP
jgi:hypothetical protein